MQSFAWPFLVLLEVLEGKPMAVRTRSYRHYQEPSANSSYSGAVCCVPGEHEPKLAPHPPEYGRSVGHCGSRPDRSCGGHREAKLIDGGSFGRRAVIGVNRLFMKSRT